MSELFQFQTLEGPSNEVIACNPFPPRWLDDVSVFGVYIHFFVLVESATHYYSVVDMQSRMMGRSADNLMKCIRIGERWRSEVRGATKIEYSEDTNHAMKIYTESGQSVVYFFSGEYLFRQVDGGAEIKILDWVKDGTFYRDDYEGPALTAWRVEMDMKEFRPATLNRQNISMTAVPRRQSL